ncbi:MAG TPA: hypothetical protein VLM91_18545 [Candidatus Methylomirabilis sp.]|nr:hypothetical protein [Candidatus Methylomirabilis sp.]
MLQPKALSVGIVMTLVLLGGCAPSASTLLTLPEDSLAQRQLQTRHFETNAEERVLAACTTVLQDMGFQIDETSPRLGVLLASKVRDTNLLRPEARLAATVLSLGILSGLAVDQPTKIEVGIVTRRVGQAEERVSVRAVFRKTPLPPNGPRGMSQTITQHEIYTQFFDSLSKALFLEARES